MFFSIAAESLSTIQGEIEELSVAAEGEYRYAFITHIDSALILDQKISRPLNTCFHVVYFLTLKGLNPFFFSSHRTAAINACCMMSSSQVSCPLSPITTDLLYSCRMKIRYQIVCSFPVSNTTCKKMNKKQRVWISPYHCIKESPNKWVSRPCTSSR
jgi:hypothetical protein